MNAYEGSSEHPVPPPDMLLCLHPRNLVLLNQKQTRRELATSGSAALFSCIPGNRDTQVLVASQHVMAHAPLVPNGAVPG
ncbi:hypothetical protein BM1_09714 [Bipolaris maydis]|nr:hypothetical protein BM1_09714 [Bipolaris maydis]